MGFLTPLFLLGGALVALPVILHLTRRRRDPVAFPSFLLLSMTTAVARFQRRRFRNVPLLILRCLALLLLAAAFAEPVWRGAAAGVAGGAPLDLAVVVDRSLSMSVGGRLDTARSLADEELAALGRDDRGLVLAFGERPVALTELTGDSAALRQAAAGITQGGGGTSFVGALGLAGRLLPTAAGRRREVLLLSDLQQSGFDEGRPQPSLPPGVTLRVRRVGAEPPANAWIAGVTLSPEGREQLAVTAEVRFAGAPAAPEWQNEVELLLGGRVVDRQAVRVASGGSASARFAPVLRPAEALAAEVRLPEDALPGDDRFHFVIHPEAAIRISDLGGDARAVYVREALGVAVTPALFLDRGPARGEGAVANALAGTRVALVRDPGRLDDGALRALGAFVEAGGGLVLAMGPRRLSAAAAAELRELAPALPEGFVDRDPAGRLGDVSTRHPVFEPFGEGGSTALGAMAFFRYRALGEPADDATVLARFDDGRPAMLEARHGEGRVLLFASSLDAEWTDLPRRPAFVPFLHRLIEVAAGHEAIPVAYRVGESVDPARAFRLGEGEAPVEEEVLVDSPGGERSVLEGAAALRLEESGLYRARRPGAATFRQIAVNTPLAESDLRTLDAAEVRMGAAAPRSSDRPATAGAPAGEPVLPEAPGRPAWPLLLAALAVLLVAEGWFANSISPRSGQRVVKASA